MSKSNPWNTPLHGSAAFTPEQVQFRSDWGLDSRPATSQPFNMSGAFAPLTTANTTYANSGGSRGEPMTPQEMAQLALSILLFPACVYVVEGSLTVLPWWAYVAAFFVLLGLSGKFERFREAMLAFGRAAMTLLAIGAFCQFIPLANRAVLAAILVPSLGYSLFVTITGKAARLDELLGQFVIWWLIIVWFLILLIIGCRVAAMWYPGSWEIIADAAWVLKMMAGSIFDAVHDLWLGFDHWFAASR